jgi:hypothetical protein
VQYNTAVVSQRTRWRAALSRVRSAAGAPGLGDRRRAETLDAYVRTAPGPANAVDIFKGQWTSKLPPPYDGLTGGVAPLYDDPRVQLALEVLGGVRGKRVLELGPLEGGHTYLLDRAGAAHILAIEGNTRAFLKCLVVKELVGMPAAHFACGDFMEYLRGTPERVDVAVASGVLYHMMSPVELLARLSRVADAVYIWTHYYDEALLAARLANARRVVSPEEAEYEGFRHRQFRFQYGSALERDDFCGGNRPEARWLTRADILAAMAHFGYSRVHPFYEQPEHPHGPAFSVVAQR